MIWRPTPPETREPLSRDMLNAFHRVHKDNTSQLLLGEILRFHDLVRDVNEIRLTLERILKDQGGGQLVVMHDFRLLIHRESALERKRRPKKSSMPPNFQTSPGEFDQDPFAEDFKR